MFEEGIPLPWRKRLVMEAIAAASGLRGCYSPRSLGSRGWSPLSEDLHLQAPLPLSSEGKGQVIKREEHCGSKL